MVNVTVHSQDSRIQYSGNWTNDGGEELTNTIHSSFAFRFNGSAIGIYGSATPSTSQNRTSATYSLDNYPAVSFTAPSSTSNLSNASFYQSPLLNTSEHRLVVTITSDGLPFYFDHLVFTPSTSNASTSSIPSPSSTSSQSAGSSSSSFSKTRAIVGGVVGGSVFLIIVAFVFLYMRFGKSNRLPDTSEAPTEKDLEAVDVPSTQVETSNSPQQTAAGNSATRRTGSSRAPGSRAARRGQPSPAAAGSLQSTPTTQPQIFHVDGGVRLAGGPDAVSPDDPAFSEVPPAYMRHS